MAAAGAAGRRRRSSGSFGVAVRQTTGFVKSLLRLIGLDRAVPDFSTLSRRQKTLKVDLLSRIEGPLHLLVDRMGITVEAEGCEGTVAAVGPRKPVARNAASMVARIEIPLPEDGHRAAARLRRERDHLGGNPGLGRLGR
jgi:hypothetical protein